jgi:hypothetical protein
MKRKTEAKMVSEFEFNRSEIEHLGLESEQWDFMEGVAREDLRVHGLPFMGGIVKVDFGYGTRTTILTLSI